MPRPTDKEDLEKQGREMKKVLRLFLYDAKFVEMSEKEKARLEKLLGPKVLITHIGSTAVPGLGGKGIIDIVVGVPKQSDLHIVANELAQNGYFFDLDNENPEDRIFLASREHNSTLGDYHIHVVVKNGDEWNQLIFFRDSLRNNEKLRNEYIDLKEKLFTTTGADREKYKKQKSDFIEKAVKGDR
ncbi:GrpB family protein [Candidatus Saccharibacteria bacterium]|nr:GrpB family protein [Candidatus Saccharibacteria bacterium]